MFEVYNSNYTKILDEHYPRMCITRILTLSSLIKDWDSEYEVGRGFPPREFRTRRYRRYNLWLQEGEKLVAFKAPRGSASGFIGWMGKQGMYSIAVYTAGDATEVNLSEVKIYVFGHKPSTGGNIGVQVFDSYGNIVFNSNQSPLKVFDTKEIFYDCWGVLSAKLTREFWLSNYSRNNVAVIMTSPISGLAAFRT